DVAKMAGVSTTTVSRVLNQKPDVKEDTKRLILEIIKNNDYYPSALAKGTSINKSHTLGLVITDDRIFVNPFFVEVLRGINHAAAAAGYFALLCTAESNNDSPVSIFKQKRVDGIILISPRLSQNPIEELIKEKVPFISTSKITGIAGLNYVDVDNFLGAKLAVEHLVMLGHKRIGLIGGPSNLASSYDRKKAFCDTLKLNGLKIHEELMVEGDHSSESGYSCMEKLLAVDELPTSVFIAGDIMAFGAMQHLKQKNILVPRDMSIVGFDDVPLTKLVDPPLTTVRQFPFRKGFTAANHLINMLKGYSGTPVKELLPVELIIRQSAAAPKPVY
ncbi:MAG: LacI family transcriptional regulator, partial [Firmicutes bacterium]|nr:LacI family transcriptional regulator [Bacillota bacterium]